MKTTKTTSYDLILPAKGLSHEKFSGYQSLLEAKSARETIRRGYPGKVLLVRNATGA